MTIHEQITVMQAYVEGKEIQERISQHEHKRPFDDVITPSWNWQKYEYRIKPEPDIIYPIFCKALWERSDVENLHLIVKFTDKYSGTVIESNVLTLPVGHNSKAWFSHLAKTHWQQIQEPKQSITLLECIKGPTDLGRYSSEWLTQEQYDSARPGIYIKILRTITI